MPEQANPPASLARGEGLLELAELPAVAIGFLREPGAVAPITHGPLLFAPRFGRLGGPAGGSGPPSSRPGTPSARRRTGRAPAADHRGARASGRAGSPSPRASRSS